MTEGEPEPADVPGQSLAARIGPAMRASLASLTRPRQPADPDDSPRAGLLLAAGIALLLALGPIVTSLGANLMANRARAEAGVLKTKAAPRTAAAGRDERDRAALAAAVRSPGVGAVIEAVARALPAEAALASAQRGSDGLLQIEVRAPDPDRLRAALRREPMLAAMRNTGQRQDGAGMLVTLREQP